MGGNAATRTLQGRPGARFGLPKPGAPFEVNEVKSRRRPFCAFVFRFVLLVHHPAGFSGACFNQQSNPSSTITGREAGFIPAAFSPKDLIVPQHSSIFAPPRKDDARPRGWQVSCFLLIILISAEHSLRSQARRR